MSFELWIESQYDVIESINLRKLVVRERQYTPYQALIIIIKYMYRKNLRR